MIWCKSQALMVFVCVCAMEQVLMEFPCELVSAVVAGRWAAASSPCRPWMAGYRARLAMAGVVTAIVRSSPLKP